jgi:hypothetical protein
MQDEYQPLTEFAPVWKRIDPDNPPAWVKNKKMLFKTDHGAATIGVHYPGCGWNWACGLPKHSEEDKAFLRKATMIYAHIR